jgi:hypothetical protein
MRRFGPIMEKCVQRSPAGQPAGPPASQLGLSHSFLSPDHRLSFRRPTFCAQESSQLIALAFLSKKYSSWTPLRDPEGGQRERHFIGDLHFPKSNASVAGTLSQSYQRFHFISFHSLILFSFICVDFL